MLFAPHEDCARQVCWLPLESITPRPSVGLEPTDGATLLELTESIRTHGVIEPITVQRIRGGRYRIISGNRRFMACRMAGLSHIDAVVLEDVAEDETATHLLEGLLDGRMHYLQQARAMHLLVTEHGFTREELARSLGCTAAGVSMKMQLSQLDEELQRYLVEQGLPERYARALARLPDRRARLCIARQAVREKLCVRDVELLVASAQARLPVPPLPGGKTIALVRDHRLYLNAIRNIVAQMQEAGIPATTAERTLGDSVEVVLRLPTRRRRARQSVR